MSLRTHAVAFWVPAHIHHLFFHRLPISIGSRYYTRKKRSVTLFLVRSCSVAGLAVELDASTLLQRFDCEKVATSREKWQTRLYSNWFICDIVHSCSERVAAMWWNMICTVFCAVCCVFFCSALASCHRCHFHTGNSAKHGVVLCRFPLAGSKHRFPNANEWQRSDEMCVYVFFFV